MRSRLETRWAAFFDELGWPWVYEPFQLGNYVPDFVLQFHEPLLVEVKGDYSIATNEIIGRAKLGGWPGELVIVREGLVPCSEFDGWSMGKIHDPQVGDSNGDPGALGTSPARIARCECCREIAVFDALMSYHCRKCGESSGNPGGESEEKLIEEAWARACNATRFAPCK